MPDSKKIRHNNIKKEHQKSFLMVAATGWASPLDPRQCALCGRCAVSTTLTPQCLSSMVCTKSLCQSLFDMLTKKVSNRQRWYGIPKDVSEIERSLNKFLKNDSDRSLGPLLTDWYNNNTIGGDNHRLLIDTVNSFLTFSDSLGQILWIHRDCAEFSPDIRRDERETWYNVLEAVRNASDVKCVRCSYQGATIVCSDLSCKSRLHRHCAIEIRAKSWRDYAELKDSDEGVPVPPPSLNSSYFCWKHRASFSFYTVERNRNAIPLKFVGHEVEKDFGTQGKFVGIVWHYDPCAKYFNVVYEDGDSEEISLTDLIPILVEDRLSLRLKRSEDLWNALKVRLLGTLSFFVFVLWAKPREKKKIFPTSLSRLHSSNFTKENKNSQLTQ